MTTNETARRPDGTLARAHSRRWLIAALPSCSLAAFLVAAPLSAQAPDPFLVRAKALMQATPMIDGHNDLPWEVRTRFGFSFDSLDISKDQTGKVMTDIARLRSGMVGAQFWSTYSPSTFEGKGAARVGFEQDDIVHRMVARYPETFEMAYTAADIERIHKAGKIASLIGLEGGHMIENSLALLRAFYADGVRYMTLTHYSNTMWADAATDSMVHRGLTPFGEEVVREMNRLGMLVDISHVSDSTMWDVLRVTQAPVFFSHSSSRHFSPHKRDVPDDILRAVAQNGGVVMVNFYPTFLSTAMYEWDHRQSEHSRQLRAAHVDSNKVADSMRAWVAKNPPPLPNIQTVADHMDWIKQVAGVDHIGIGSDFDGIDIWPNGLNDVSTFPALIAELLRRGWTDADASKVIGGNALRVMRETEAVAARLQRERKPSVAQIEILDHWKTKPPLEGPGR